MSGTTPPTQIGGTILESGIWTALNDAGHAGNSSSETGGSDSEDEEIDGAGQITSQLFTNVFS